MSALIRVHTGFRVEWCCNNANLPLAQVSIGYTGMVDIETPRPYPDKSVACSPNMYQLP
jgi:hypothetical protein